MEKDLEAKEKKVKELQETVSIIRKKEFCDVQLIISNSICSKYNGDKMRI